LRNKEKDLEILSAELMKDKPNQKLVREIMLKYKITHGPSQVEQMGALLEHLNSTSMALKKDLKLKDL
jgi:hypothetical protein